MTPEQCRAARALLNWSLVELAEAASVNRNTVYHFEHGHRQPRQSTLRLLRETFERHGVQFLQNGDGPGVRLLNKPTPDS